MRIVFFGTPAFAVPSLEVLLTRAGEQVVAVVTQPDRPRGRSHSTLEPSPVKHRALSAGVPVLQPERPTGPDFVAALTRAEPDLGVVVAYGHILKPEILAAPKLGMINVHASLLPAWRGAAPIAWSILAGDQTTGVTIIQLEQGLDSGPVLHAASTSIGPEETAGQLAARLSTLGAGALDRTLDLYAEGAVTACPQDHSRATFAPKIDRALARIRWDQPAEQVARRILAFDPAPGAWTTLGDLEVKCFGPSLRRFSGTPGSVLVSGPELVIAAGAGSVALGEVQPAGKRRMSAADWIRGHPLGLGTRLA
jgi:methionyl-tRNA formyltransferase